MEKGNAFKISKDAEMVLTSSGLRDHLNDKFGSKLNNTKFNAQDIEGYIRRGYIPKWCGGNKIVEAKNIKGVRAFKIIKKNEKIKV
jgi:hypothetical protein